MKKYVKKSWQEKLADSKGFPKVCQIDGAMSKRWGTGTFVIPAPMEVDELMRRVPRGKLTTIDELRKILARKHGASIACPLTTGIFAWIAAHASAEAAAEGKKRTTPFWRTLSAKGELNPKYPGGIAGLTRRLSEEGHQVVQKGKRVFVVNFEASLVTARADATPHAQPPRRSMALEGSLRTQDEWAPKNDCGQ
jgi:hypothetical protein